MEPAAESPDTPDLPTYLDCAATTPVDPRVLQTVVHYMRYDYGNSGSHHHIFGTRAKQALESARRQVANVADAKPDEVFFTSGATESNNLAILGLEQYGCETGHKHIVSTAIEHKAVLEPLKQLETRGFEITYIAPDGSGRIHADDVLSALRPDTLLLSVMHVNNETGVIQPIREIANGLTDHSAYFHCDSAQGFGKELQQLTSRVDMISVSGHKLYAPKGVGALIARKRRFRRPPLLPLCWGGGQERGLRSGTLPVPLCAGLGHAAELMVNENDKWLNHCRSLRQSLFDILQAFNASYHTNLRHSIPSIVSVSFSDIDADAVILALKDVVAISNGSACTSSGSETSHVLHAMGLSDAVAQTVTRWSWSHMTNTHFLDRLRDSLQRLA